MGKVAPERQVALVVSPSESRLPAADYLSLLANISSPIVSSPNLPNLLHAVIDGARAVTGACYGALEVFDRAGRVQVSAASGGPQDDKAPDAVRQEDVELLAWLRHHSRPLRLEHASAHPRIVALSQHAVASAAFLGIPIRCGSEALGALCVMGRTGGGEFTATDENALVLLASQAALAICNTERCQREMAAHAEVEAGQRLQTLVEMSPVGVLVVDAATQRIALVNREMQRLTRSPCVPGDLVDQCRRGIVYRRADGSMYASNELPIERAMREGENVRAEEVRFEFADGGSAPTLISAAPVYSPEGQIRAGVSIIQDISPLEDVERLRSEFLGMVSHELKTPLAAIKGAAATVLGSPEPFSPVETRELFSIINNQSDRLRGMVDNVLQMASIESGSLSISPAPVELGALLRDAVASFTRVEGGRDIRVPDPRDLPTVQVDRARILQVMANLLSNAAKFSQPESPITISAERDSTQVIVHVRDQGRGIPREKLPHLFRKFSRIHENGDSRLSGTGLGLAISKGIVEAHGGRIWAETPGEGLGSTFSFTLPLAMQQPVLARGAGAEAPAHRVTERAQVLIMDDEVPTLRYVQRHLRQAGYQPLPAVSAAEVVTLVEHKQPALVLLALHVTEVNGIDLFRRIRAISSVPVIILAASDDQDATARALNAGVDDYITKPFSSSELLARVAAALRHRPNTDANEERPSFAVGGLTVNFAERRVTVGGHEVHLTATEYKVLRELVVHAGQVLTHDQLLRRAWGPEYSQEPELVRSLVRHLRQKLGEDARRPRYILTERQVGYHMSRA